MGRVQRGVVLCFVDEPSYRGVLVAGQLDGVVGVHEVGASDRSIQQASAGEDGLLIAVRHDVREVRVRVAGCCDGLDPQLADGDDLAVGDGLALVVDGVRRVDEVGRAGLAGKDEAAGDVVVVDVGFGDVGDPCARVRGGSQDAVGVALGVDDKCDLAVVNEVAAVPELRGFDDGYMHCRVLSITARRARRRCRGRGRPHGPGMRPYRAHGPRR